MTLFSTITAGVTVFVFGQIILKWAIEPIQQLKEVISGIIYHFSNDYTVIQNSRIVQKEEAIQACKNLESLGAKLLAKQHLVPFYKNIHNWFGLPNKESIYGASKYLSLISKSAFSEEQDIHIKLDIYRKKVCKYCLIEDPIQDGETIESLKSQLSTNNA